MTTRLVYSSGSAFRAALRDRFKTVVMTDPRYTFNELQRHFAYDRALARCFSGPDAHRWVLKGAGALLARLEQARHSKDVDLYYAERAAAADEAESALLRALDQDIGDHFIFERVRSFALPEAAKGRRVHVSARLGGKVYAAFHIDVVVGTTMSGEPDTVPPLTPIELPGLVRPAYRAFPLEDHIADKLSATVETHRQAGEDRPSTRVKDLVDLALIATTQRVSAARLREAIRAGFAHRGVEVPRAFTVPDDTAWRTRYPRVAQDAPGPMPSYEQAVGLVARLLDPILDGETVQSWDPVTASWT